GGWSRPCRRLRRPRSGSAPGSGRSPSDRTAPQAARAAASAPGACRRPCLRDGPDPRLRTSANYEIIIRMMARWIRLGAIESQPFDLVYARLAAVQSSGAAPALLWAQAETQYLFALIAPRKLA